MSATDGTSDAPRIDGDRLWALLESAAAVGATADGGVRRLALGDEDRLLRGRLVAWCRAAGCEIRVDRIGNVFARRAGRENQLPPVLMGSHLDTQFAAGRFDGALGVLAGVELLRTLAEHDRVLRRPLELVCWTSEEGARFGPTMLGSGAFAGVHELATVLAARDDAGVSVGEALALIGYAGSEPVGGRRLDAYFELHIEQGPQLDAEGIEIGVVTGAWPTRSLTIDVTGETAHAGPTPMPMRRNALVGAARVVQAIDELAHQHAPAARTTSTRIECWPNCPGIVPARVRLLADMRHPRRAVVEQMVAQVRDAAAAVAAATGLELAVAVTGRFGDLRFDPECVALVQRAADELGLSTRPIDSQAGHDAYHLAALCPTAMIFCPCRDGVSHHPREWAERHHVEAGANVLMRAVVARADR